MATAGTPPSATPSSALSRRNNGQEGASAASPFSAAAPTSDAAMRVCGPMRSDTMAAATIESAKKPVLNEIASELAAAPSPNARAKVGSSGCGQ